MEGRKEKKLIFSQLLISFSFKWRMNGRRRNWTWNLRKGCSMETVWKQWVSRQYWRKRRSNSGWCEQTLILSLPRVWGVHCMLQDGALHRQWTSLYEKLGSTGRKARCILEKALQLLLSKEVFRLDNITKTRRFWQLICVYESVHQINPISSKPFHLAVHSWKTPSFTSQEREHSFIPCPPPERPFGPETLKTRLWTKISTVLESIKFMAIVGWCPCFLAQLGWQPTFPWEALKLLSGLGVMAGLHVFGVRRGTQALASLPCLALPVSHSFSWVWSLFRMYFSTDVVVKTNFKNIPWLYSFMNLKNLVHMFYGNVQGWTSENRVIC